MNDILNRIMGRIDDARQNKRGFLDILFGKYIQQVMEGRPVVLFGAGVIGGELCNTLKSSGIIPLCFCDNDVTKCGKFYRDTPVISFDKLKKSYGNCLIVLATKTYFKELEVQLLENGFSSNQIICNKFDIPLSTFIRDGSQTILGNLKHSGTPQQLIGLMKKNHQKVFDAYQLLADKKSKRLFISRLAYMASYDDLNLLGAFMREFSEPILQFGNDPKKSVDENYFYFHNDIYELLSDEVFVDVGAYNGDTLKAFVRAYGSKRVKYKHIYAFEPDPKNYQALINIAKKIKNISCYQLGLWSESRSISFLTSENAFIKSNSAISDAGDISIRVVKMDEFLKGKEVTFIKMDPGITGHIIIEAIKGSADTILKFKPKLALGAYHSFESIFELPLLINKICPAYKMYLRHHSWCFNETDLLAYV